MRKLPLRELLTHLGGLSRVANSTISVHLPKDKWIDICFVFDEYGFGPKYTYRDGEVRRTVSEIPSTGNLDDWHNVDLDSKDWEVSECVHRAIGMEMMCLIDDMSALWGELK